MCVCALACVFVSDRESEHKKAFKSSMLAVKQGAVVLPNFSLGAGAALQVRRWKKEGRERQTFHYFNQLLTGLKFLHNLGHDVSPWCPR